MVAKLPAGILRGATLAAVLAGIAVARAQDGVGGALTLTSDYIFRGISQSRGNPAAQADLHFAARGWSVGLWGSSVELNAWEGRTLELNAYAGYRWQFGREWDAKFSAVHYEYPLNDSNVRYDYNEVVGTVGFRNIVFATMSWSPNASRYSPAGYQRRKQTFSYELATALPLVSSIAANLGVGYFDVPSPFEDGYFYWNAGISYDWRAWRADLSYIGTEDRAERLSYSGFGGDRIAITVSWRY
jgi:uncharacterized protein (TIGR02001 family)